MLEVRSRQYNVALDRFVKHKAWGPKWVSNPAKHSKKLKKKNSRTTKQISSEWTLRQSRDNSDALKIKFGITVWGSLN